MSYADVRDRRSGSWCSGPPWYGYRRIHPGAIVLTVTGTEAPPGLAMLDMTVSRFHVEQGRVMLADAA